MATMVAPSWMSNMMGRLATLNTLDMVGMCRSYLSFLFTIFQKNMYRHTQTPKFTIIEES